MRKLAPASTFARAYLRSSWRLGASGWTSGKQAAPTQKSKSPPISSISSTE